MQAKIYLALCLVASLFIGAQCGMPEGLLEKYKEEYPNNYVCDRLSTRRLLTTTYHETCFGCCTRNNRKLVSNDRPCLCEKYEMGDKRNPEHKKEVRFVKKGSAITS